MRLLIQHIQILCGFWAFIGLLGLAPAYAQNTPWIEWHSTNIQGLAGNGYELGAKERRLITLEHANKWRYGDFYGFCDITFEEGNSDESIYCEAAPRLSLSKISGRSFSYGIVQDVFFGGQIEKGEDSLERYNIGPGVNLNLPGFKFFKVNLYWRNNPDRTKSTYQVYTAWNMPLEVGGAKFLLEGFADFFGEEGGNTAPSQLLQPRFLLDAGHLAGQQENRLFVGFEYQYWHNKFGINGVTESLPQLQVKWVF